MEYPIHNRYVSDITYAVRQLSLLRQFFGYINSSICLNEEYEYMCRVACELINFQVATATSSDEKSYFSNLVKDYKDGDDIIKYHICKYDKPFEKFLVAIKAIKPNKEK